MPLISVVIPVYNGEKTIKETVDSALSQTFSDLELIVINDGSQDSTLDILSDISDPRLKVFSYSNAGLAASRNRGIEQASGKYIAFLDADDLWTADKLEAQLNALWANPQASVAYSWTDWIDESNQFLRSGGHIVANGQVYTKLLIRNFVENGSNPLICKQALDTVGGFDDSVPGVEDWDMWLRLAAHYEFVTVPSPQILYRISANSMSTNVWKMEKSSLRVVERAFAEASLSSELDSSTALKRKVIGSCYQYLIVKALEGNLERRRGLAAVRFLAVAIANDPTWLKRPKLMAIILFKIAVAILLPQYQAKKLLMAIKSVRQNQVPV
ncbi:MAG: glycosyltransferase [Leptolyngbyaceae cyanobacterium SL_5_9]|nr:glycosyltransferase [Leptolyngbyaceae cyanobacterium SL_5_9]